MEFLRPATVNKQKQNLYQWPRKSVIKKKKNFVH